MSPQEIRKHYVNRPFIPFRIVMVDGAEYVIEDPSIMGMDLLAIYVGLDPDESGLPQRSVWLSPSHVSRIEPLPDHADTTGPRQS